MSLLALIPSRLYEYALIILACGLIATGFIVHERSVGAVKVEAVRTAEHAAQAAVAASAIAKNQTETTRRIAATMETVNVTIQHAQAVAADASAVSAQLVGLRHDIAARSRAAAADPSASGAGSTASDTVMVLSELLQRAGDRAAGLAQLADERGVAGNACVRQYESLTP